MSYTLDYKQGENVYVLYPPKTNDIYEMVKVGQVLQTRKAPAGVLVQFTANALCWVHPVFVYRTDPRKAIQ